METQLLREPQVSPSEEVLKNALGDSYFAYDDLIKIVTGVENGLITEWNYYKDGKAWLCKVIFKKKTVLWLSVWDNFFKAGFYFTEKNKRGIEELDIAESIKEDFKNQKPVGKLLPLVMKVYRKDQIEDLLKVIAYKKQLR